MYEYFQIAVVEVQVVIGVTLVYSTCNSYL